MKVCVTIAEKTSSEWVVLREPDTDVLAHKAVVQELAREHGTGQHRVLVLSSGGVLKKAKLNLTKYFKPKRVKGKTNE